MDNLNLFEKFKEFERIFDEKDVIEFRKLKPYFLFNGEPVKAMNFEEFLSSFNKDRIIAKSKIGKTEVSTVFLHFNYGSKNEEKPEIFESMIFSDFETLDGETIRYSILLDAVEGHNLLCQMVEMKTKEKIIHIINNYEKYL